MTNEKNSAKISGMRQGTHDSVDKIMDKAESMKKSSSEQIANMKEKATMMKDNAESYIKENPAKSVLIAAGIGAVAGAALVAATKMRRKQ